MLRYLMPALFCAACGGRAQPEDVVDAGAIADAPQPHERCRSADGVRLCGAGCPAIPAPACPGWGCTSAYDIDGAPSAAGVCWTDRSDKGSRLCGQCDWDEVCMYRGPQELVCTSRAVCDALAELGVRDVCRYTDLSPYDGRPFAPSPPSCPVLQGMNWLCGGACGICTDPLGPAYCPGRSPAHPFGLCNAPTLSGRPETCDACSGQCGVFETQGVDPKLAWAYGFCMPIEQCLPVARYAGAGCYVNGQRAGP